MVGSRFRNAPGTQQAALDFARVPDERFDLSKHIEHENINDAGLPVD
jgi:hypothetical protein